jgi:hypothetical protein
VCARAVEPLRPARLAPSLKQPKRNTLSAPTATRRRARCLTT